MKKILLFFALLLAVSAKLMAQGTQAAGFTSWFTVKNNALVVQTGSKTTPLAKNVVLINGTRLDFQTRTASLPGGQKVELHEGDMVTLYGEVHQSAEAKAAAKAAATPAPAPTPAPATLTASVAAPAPAAEAAKPAVVAPAAFTFRPMAPVAGKLKGVVELGASGFNSFIVRVDGQRNWQLEKSEFGNSLVMENLASEEDIRKGLKAYIGKMLDYGVGGRDIHFVVSSGALAAEGTQKIIKELRALNYVVTTVTAEREGALGLRAAVPAAYADKAFLADMGSGNTKLAWLEEGAVKSMETYGSKFYVKNVEPATVTADVKAKAQQVPGELRSTCFIIGGMPYEWAKPLRQGTERYTVLQAPASYTQQTGAKAQAGATIYQALADATGCKQFVFDWDANFTIGYLLTLP